MKRFYKTVEVRAGDSGHAVLLDGRAIKTPARAALAVPSAALAAAIAAEWDAQGEEIDPRAMPATGLANAAIDRVLPDPAQFAAMLGAYAETDLLCYRAEGPEDLAARQAATWDPLLAWARARYDVAFEVTAGILHRAQPPETVARLRQALASQPPFALSAFSPLVTIGGSLVAALAVAERAVEPDAAFDATHLDEIWQAEQWGEDWAATDAREARRRDFTAAARFLALL